MKTWNKYLWNEWIVLAPIITIFTIVCNTTIIPWLNELSYYIAIISLILLFVISVFRVFIGWRNEYRAAKVEAENLKNANKDSKEG